MSLEPSREAMKVTFIITGLGTGGAELMLYKLVQRSTVFRRGRIIALGGEGELVKRFRAVGMQVDTLGMRSALPNPLALVTLTGMLRRDKPDLVSTWLYHADLIGGLAARWAGVPVVWGIRSSDLPADTTKFATRAVVRVCATLSHHVPTVIACCSHRARAIHEGLGYPAERFRVVPNGFDLELFRPDPTARSSMRAELGLPPDTPLIGLIARFDPHKNHQGFLEAAALVVARRPDVHFLLVGGGVDKYNARLVSGVQALGLDGKAHLLGLRQDIPRVMASLDVVASPSWTEAFPNVLGEAMACGVPCVVTDVGDSAYVVGDSGTVVPKGDMAGLADGLLRTLTLPLADRRALGEKARARVTAHFEIGAVTREYEQLFRKVAKGCV